MAFGLTTSGLIIKRFEDVLASLQDRAKAEFGEDIDVSTDSVLGQFLSTTALDIANLWELAEAVNSGFNPSEAEGVQLDDCADLIGIARLASQPSTVWVEFIGDVGTVIPLGTTVSMSSTQDKFQVLNTDTLNATLCTGLKVNVSTVTNSAVYTITVNGYQVTYTSDGSATNLEIAAGLKSAFDLLTGLTAIAACTNNGDGTLQINLVPAEINGTTRLSATVTANLTIVKTTKAIECECTIDGPTPAPATTVNTIETSLSGLDSVTNRVDAVLGRDTETDSEFRSRRILSLKQPSAATKDAILAEIRAIAGVTDAYVFENIDITTDGDGRPGKSFEVIVQGGDDQDIADAIWAVKPVGIETTNRGSAPGVTVTDSAGYTQTVYFSRPTTLPIYVEVDYTLFAEEDFPVDGETMIASLVETYGNSIGIGKDILPQRFFGDIFANVSGISTLVVRVSDDGITFATTPLVIGAFEIPTFDLSRITVTQV